MWQRIFRRISLPPVREGEVEVTACNWGRNMTFTYVESVGGYIIVVRLGVEQRAKIQSIIPES